MLAPRGIRRGPQEPTRLVRTSKKLVKRSFSKDCLEFFFWFEFEEEATIADVVGCDFPFEAPLLWHVANELHHILFLVLKLYQWGIIRILGSDGRYLVLGYLWIHRHPYRRYLSPCGLPYEQPIVLRCLLLQRQIAETDLWYEQWKVGFASVEKDSDFWSVLIWLKDIVSLLWIRASRRTMLLKEILESKTHGFRIGRDLRVKVLFSGWKLDLEVKAFLRYSRSANQQRVRGGELRMESGVTEGDCSLSYLSITKISRFSGLGAICWFFFFFREK